MIRQTTNIQVATHAFNRRGAEPDHMYSDAFEFASDVLDKIKQNGCSSP